MNWGENMAHIMNDQVYVIGAKEVMGAIQKALKNGSIVLPPDITQNEINLVMSRLNQSSTHILVDDSAQVKVFQKIFRFGLDAYYAMARKDANPNMGSFPHGVSEFETELERLEHAKSKN